MKRAYDIIEDSWCIVHECLDVEECPQRVSGAGAGRGVRCAGLSIMV